MPPAYEMLVYQNRDGRWCARVRWRSPKGEKQVNRYHYREPHEAASSALAAALKEDRPCR